MDAYHGKQAVGGIAAPKKGSATALRYSAGPRDGAPQLCNRLGCCGRLNYTKGTKNKCLEKPKPSKPASRSSSSKEVTASSSKNCSSVTNVKKTLPESKKKPSSESKSVQELNAPGKLKSRNTESNKAVLMPKTPEVASLSSSTRVRRVYREKYDVAPQIGDHGVMENSDHNNGRRRSLVKKRFTEGESSSSSKGKRVSGVSPNEGRVSISDPRSLRNSTSCRGSGVSSVRTRRSVNVEASRGPIDSFHGDNPPLVQSEMLWPSVETLSTDSSLGGGRATSETSSSAMVSVTSTDQGTTHFMNHNGTRHYNIDGIADVLFALDRIEQDEELTYEQLLSLEANLFLGGLNFYDQHRDMRLDIDNMSYEELLVLEEKMGTVSTVLSEEELSKCIRISIYESSQLEDGRTRCGWDADDKKCSICQEEFVRGDEIGRMGCGHGYHAMCINQWLSLKNWCPICKASPSSPPKKLL